MAKVKKLLISEFDIVCYLIEKLNQYKIINFNFRISFSLKLQVQYFCFCANSNRKGKWTGALSSIFAHSLTISSHLHILFLCIFHPLFFNIKIIILLNQSQKNCAFHLTFYNSSGWLILNLYDKVHHGAIYEHE